MIVKDYTIISSDKDIQLAIDNIDKYEYLAFDSETTGLNTRKDKVIGLSFSGKDNEAFYISRYTWNSEKEDLVECVSESNFIMIIKKLKEKELIMWNASFDCKIISSNYGIDLLGSLSADAMLMKHTVNEDAFFTLKRTAIELQEHLKMDMELEANKEQIELKENVSKNGGSTTKLNYEMYKADLDVMGKYACSDADLTLKIARYYLDIIDKEGLSDFFFDKEVMPLYKEVTVTMEAMGISLDLDKIEKAKKEIEVDIISLEGKVLTSLMSTDEYSSWEMDHISKLFPIKNTGRFSQEFVKYFNIELPLTKSGKYSLSMSNLIESEREEDLAILFNCFDRIDKEDLYNIQKNLYLENNDLFNISSKKQMGELIFDYMKIKPLSTTKAGKAQFNETFINHLGTMDFNWTKQLSNYNKLIKIRGTYIDRFLNNHEDGIYYPSFKQHGTISGRYGSDLQQLPRPKEEGELDEIVLKYNNIIRGFFIAGKGRKFIDSDYESLEPHVFAHVSGDEGLKDIFRKGHDFYSTIAIATENMKGVSADKKADNYLGKIKKTVRQFAKAYCLGVPYGMTAFALGKTLGISTEEAGKLIDGYLNGFPFLKKWMIDSENMAKYEGYVKSEVGRIRHLSKVKSLHEKHGTKLLDFKYRNKLIKRHENRLGTFEAKKLIGSMYMDYKNGVNNAKNFQIQSLSASIVNLAAIEINRELSRRDIKGWVALQIHDQLVINVPDQSAEECRKLVQDIMENNYKLSIKLKAPAEICDNLLDGH